MNIFTRLKGKTPKFFRIVLKICIALFSLGLTIKGLPTVVDGFVLSEKWNEFATNIMVAGVIGGAIAKLTIEDVNAPTTYSAPKDEEQQNNKP